MDELNKNHPKIPQINIIQGNSSMPSMNTERGLHAVTGITLAFSLIWTIAILIPYNGHHTAAKHSTHVVDPSQFGLVVNGTHFVLGSTVGQYQAQSDEKVRIIHAASPIAIQRVSSLLFA